MKNACAGCKFFFLSEEFTQGDFKAGECKRFPRVPCTTEDVAEWKYPLQFESDECGEFKSK